VRRLAGAHDPAGLGQLHGRGISENPLDGETKVLSRKKCGAREYRHGRCREGRGAGASPPPMTFVTTMTASCGVFSRIQPRAVSRRRF